MATRLTFSILGDVQLDRTLESIESAATDLRPAWEVLRGRFTRLEARQFAGEGRYSGGWSPLSPRYAAWKAKHYPGKTILRRTDELWRSLTEGPEVAVIEPSYMVLGTAVDYAWYHQQGGRHLPRRRPVELPEAERREWMKVIQSFIRTGGFEGVRRR